MNPNPFAASQTRLFATTANKELQMQRTPRALVERAARVYASNKDASQALGIALGSFGRLCQQYEIETPHARRRRRRQESRRQAA